MSALLLNLESSLAAAGFARSVVLGGPIPSCQAFGVVVGNLCRVPVDGYAVASLETSPLSRSGCPLLPLPRIRDVTLKDQMAGITRAAIALFTDAKKMGLRSLALAVPEDAFFGEMDHSVAVQLIRGAADIFWRSEYSHSVLDRIVVAVEVPEFIFSF